MGRFLNADAFASTGQGLLGNNMFAYCLNNPIMCSDATGMSPFGALELWDYYIIHKVVQVLCVAEKGWDMEVYVTGPNGNGFLDLYDPGTNTYYEVKSKGASNRKYRLNKQMTKYDTSQISADRYSSENITESPKRGTEWVSGEFAYGIWDVEYRRKDDGLIVYDTEINNERSLGTAVAIAIILCLATGNYEAAASIGYAYATAS